MDIKNSTAWSTDSLRAFVQAVAGNMPPGVQCREVPDLSFVPYKPGTKALEAHHHEGHDGPLFLKKKKSMLRDKQRHEVVLGLVSPAGIIAQVSGMSALVMAASDGRALTLQSEWTLLLADYLYAILHKGPGGFMEYQPSTLGGRKRWLPLLPDITSRPAGGKPSEVEQLETQLVQLRHRKHRLQSAEKYEQERIAKGERNLAKTQIQLASVEESITKRVHALAALRDEEGT